MPTKPFALQVIEKRKQNEGETERGRERTMQIINKLVLQSKTKQNLQV